MDTIREKTDLADSYGEVKNIPPLLICPNQKPRLPTQVLNSSVLLQNANINLGDCYSLTSRNYNDTLYGIGFESNVDLTHWKIKKPWGVSSEN